MTSSKRNTTSSCNLCNKRILVVYTDIHTCKCQKMYCSNHLQNHNCDFEYQNNYRKHIEKNLPKITKQKIIKC